MRRAAVDCPANVTDACGLTSPRVLVSSCMCRLFSCWGGSDSNCQTSDSCSIEALGVVFLAVRPAPSRTVTTTLLTTWCEQLRTRTVYSACCPTCVREGPTQSMVTGDSSRLPDGSGGASLLQRGVVCSWGSGVPVGVSGAVIDRGS